MGVLFIAPWGRNYSAFIGQSRAFFGRRNGIHGADDRLRRYVRAPRSEHGSAGQLCIDLRRSAGKSEVHADLLHGCLRFPCVDRYFMPHNYAVKKYPLPSEQESVWSYATGVPDLVRHNPSGRYYARYQVAGKRRMKALKTAVWSVAKLRLADELAKVERLRQHDRRIESGSLLIGDLLDQFQEEYSANTARAGRSKRLSSAMRRAAAQRPLGVCDSDSS